MALEPGSRLGPYEIVAPLGSGGMGEVYRARDTRLGRTVALKIVNPTWASSDEGRARFEREARVISQLNHPNVCALHDVGRDGDCEFLVMELVEGESLARRLGRGPLPIPEVVRIGQEMARGLDAAHRQGVVHRDFKPANVILSRNGAKVLDFGLARPLEDQTDADAAPTRAFETTGAGTILGTLPYMAPEQLQGQRIDARADVFALGAVLHEMTTGRRAFDAPSQAGVIAAVLDRTPPPASTVRPGVPPLLERLIARCLAKDPEDRPQTAGEVARTLALIGDASSHPGLPTTTGTSRWTERLVWLGVVGLLAAALVWARIGPAGGPSGTQPPISFEVPIVAGGSLPEVVDTANPVAMSRDGRHIAYTTTGETTQLWLHSLDTMQARPIRGTDEARGPFWSPDSRYVGFFAGGALKRVAIDGDVVEQICSTDTSVAIGSWGADDAILFVDSTTDALMRVRASGGTPQPVLSTRGKGTTWPHLLPDGLAFVMGSPSGIYRGSVHRRELTRILEESSAAAYAPSGHLLYVREGALLARRFDPATGGLAGEPRALAEGLQYFAPTAGASFSVAETGAIVYRRSNIVPRRLVWIARDGRELGDAAPAAPWEFKPRLSRDGRHLLISQQIPASGSTDLWVFDLESGTPTRLTADVEVDNWPAWWPDGRSVVFSRSAGGRAPHLVRQGRTDAAGTPRELFPPAGFHYDPEVAPDGSAVAFGQAGDIWLWRTDTSAAEPLIQTRFAEGGPAFSPDGQLLAYDSNVSGRTEVYIRPFGRPGEAVRVSTAGGSGPRWRGDGREIFFSDPQGSIMGARVVPGDPVTAGRPEPLGPRAGGISGFDVTRDGQRFIALTARHDSGRAPFVVLLNWERLMK